MVPLLQKPSRSFARSRSFALPILFFSLVSLTAGTAVPSSAQQTDDHLQKLLADAIEDFRGDVGVYVHHLTSDQTVSINADETFPSASLIKVAIMVNVFDKIEKGDLKMNQVFTFSDSLRTAGAGFLGGFRDGEPVTVREMLDLMMAASDNSAALWLQHLSGTGESINGWLESNGYSTRVNAGTPGRLNQWKKYNWGQTTPRDIATLMVAISEEQVVSPEASEKMYRMMSHSFADTEALAMIPPRIQTISKQASIKNSRSEVVLVNAPHGPYVFAVLTKNIKDTSWEEDNEAFELIRNVSSILFNYFEPEYEWATPKRKVTD